MKLLEIVQNISEKDVTSILTKISLLTVRQLSWLEVYLSEDVDEAVHLLSKNLTNVLDEMAPLRTIQIRKNYNPFISKETKELMKARDKLQQLASKN